MKTGWSVKTGHQTPQPPLGADEQAAILEVIKRAEQIELSEQERVSLKISSPLFVVLCKALSVKHLTNIVTNSGHFSLVDCYKFEYETQLLKHTSNLNQV